MLVGFLVMGGWINFPFNYLLTAVFVMGHVFSLSATYLPSSVIWQLSRKGTCITMFS